MKKTKDYYDSVHRFGRRSTLMTILLMFMVPLVTTIVYKIDLDIKTILSAAFQLCVVFIPTQLTEVISFSPILGSGGTYMSFVTGNVMNMKLPAAASGHKLAKVDPSSDEGEVVSVLAIGMSSITTTLVLFLGMFLLTPFLVYLNNPILQPAFANIMPALLGAMVVPYLTKNPEYCLVPFILAILAGTLIPAERYGSLQAYLLIVVMVVSVFLNVKVNKDK